MKRKDLTGKRFGRWVVLKLTGTIQRASYNEAVWLCLCDCGAKREVRTRLLLRGKGGSASCGCARTDTIRVVQPRRTHGKSQHPLYRIWKTMRQRCNNSRAGKYQIYGGRGIKVCPRWESFEVFLEDMRDGWSPGLQIDRIDNDGNYEPGNCRWTTPVVQANNTRANVILNIGGSRLTLAQTARQFGINASTIRYRLRNGWNVDQAVHTPPRRKR